MRMVVMERVPHFMHPIVEASLSQAAFASTLVGLAACFIKVLHPSMSITDSRGLSGRGTKAAPRARLCCACMAAVQSLESL